FSRDWSSDVCSSDLSGAHGGGAARARRRTIQRGRGDLRFGSARARWQEGAVLLPRAFQLLVDVRPRLRGERERGGEGAFRRGDRRHRGEPRGGACREGSPGRGGGLVRRGADALPPRRAREGGRGAENLPRRRPPRGG